MPLSILAIQWVFAVHAQIETQGRDCRHTVTDLNCVEVVKNYDGDTFTANIEQVHPLLGKQIHVRVKGIDAPEMDSENDCEREAAQKAQQEFARLLKESARVDLKQVKRDKYFRVLADVTIDGQPVSEHMIRRGLAVPYDGKTKPDVNWCKKK